MMSYYVPLKPGAFKTYSTPDDSFWCCVGTGMENHAKYGDTIYFHDDQSLYVNLFIPSRTHLEGERAGRAPGNAIPRGGHDEADLPAARSRCASP